MHLGDVDGRNTPVFAQEFGIFAMSFFDGAGQSTRGQYRHRGYPGPTLDLCETSDYYLAIILKTEDSKIRSRSSSLRLCCIRVA